MESGDVYIPIGPGGLPTGGTSPAYPSSYPSAAPASDPATSPSAYPTRPASLYGGAEPSPGTTAGPFGRPSEPSGPFGRARKRIGSAAAAVIALVAKFFAAIKALFLVLPNVKLITTAGTALVSVAAYSLFWGWEFAAGFVVLLFLHEMGHVIQLRREGIRASAPMFIPFLGAMITARSLGENALAEARVGLAGPILGSLAAAAVAIVGGVIDSPFLLALAYVGFLINLFNLLPVVPLDGGRAMAAMAPWMWFLGFGGLVAMAFIFPNPIMLIIILFGGMETWRRWKLRGTRSLEQAAYYRVSPRHRLMVGGVYIGLIAALCFGMYETHILTAAGQSFRTI
jgi:Zn-dependent protease